MNTYVNNIFGQKNILKKWFKSYRIHLLSWSLFIIYEVLVVGLAANQFGELNAYIFHYAVNIALFYTHAMMIMPIIKSGLTRSVWLLPLAVVLEIVVYIIINYLVDKLMEGYFDWQKFNPEFQLHLMSLWRCIYFISFATAYYYLEDYLKMQKISRQATDERHRLEIKSLSISEELKTSQNAYLKAQINPHFFFNTLTFLHSLTLKTEPIAAEGIIIFSRIMRYAIDTDQRQEFIMLVNELEQVENLLRLQRLRKQMNFNINFTYGPEVEQVLFIPLVILTLVENMFKHGNLCDAAHAASIEVYLAEATLHIKTINKLGNGFNTSGQQMGLINIKKRLRTNYGEAATFDFYKSETLFHTHIRLALV